MNESLFEQLLDAHKPEILCALIQEYKLTEETIQELKDKSAEFYAHQPRRALKIAELAHRLAPLLTPPAAALGNWALGNAFMFVNQYIEAISHFEEAHTEYIENQDDLNAARVGVIYLVALASVGRYEQAIELAEEIEPILTESAQTEQVDLQRLGSLLLNKGMAYELWGQYEKTLPVYESLTEIATQLNNDVLLARAQHNRAVALTILNDFHNARKIFEEVEPILVKNDLKLDLVRLYMNQARLFSTINEYEDAQTNLDKAERYLKNIDGMTNLGHTLIVFRAWVALRGKDTPSLKLINELVAIQSTLPEYDCTFVDGIACIVLGQCYLIREEWDKARTAFEQVVEHRSLERSVRCQALHGLGKLEECLGQSSKAIALYEESIKQIEYIRQEIYVEMWRATFLIDKLVVYQDLALLYSSLGQMDKAFQTVERAKSRLMVERLAFQLDTEVAKLTASEHPNVRKLAQKLTETLAELDRLHRQENLNEQNAQDTPDSEQLSITEQLEKLEYEVQNLLQGIQYIQPLFSPLTLGNTVALSNIQVHLQKNALFLQYHIIHEYVWVFVIDKTRILGHYQLATRSEIEEVRNWLSMITDGSWGLFKGEYEKIQKIFPQLIANVQKYLQTLYDLLIPPEVKALQAETPIIISPDDLLHYIPFHALYDGKQYLLENHPISYTPSATVLELCLRHQPNESGMLLVGYSHGDLPQIRAEMAAIHQLFPQALKLIEDQAQVPHVLASAPHSRFIHIASHAKFRFDNPMLSSISLADRKLTLAEIVRLQLGADLVVLSGCETGYGELQGADMLSLAGGFLGAGASSLLVSLWRVEDKATARLMKYFYQELLSGQSRATALRNAQRTLIEQGRQATDERFLYQHPAFWAPFVLIGNWHPLSPV